MTSNNSSDNNNNKKIKLSTYRSISFKLTQAHIQRAMNIIATTNK